VVDQRVVERVLDRDAQHLLDVLHQQGVVRRRRLTSVHRRPHKAEQHVPNDQQRRLEVPGEPLLA
jgi:hypothetical protein